MFIPIFVMTIMRNQYKVYLLFICIVLSYSPRNMETFERNNIPMITLDVRISCDTFWNYKFNVPIRIADYYDVNSKNIMNSHRGVGGGGVGVGTNMCSHEINRDPLFCKLEDYLVNYVIQHIYDDLMRTNQQRDIPILLNKSRKFHIHGRTIEDILFPTVGNRNTDTHAMPENILYICTHC